MSNFNVGDRVEYVDGPFATLSLVGSQGKVTDVYPYGSVNVRWDSHSWSTTHQPGYLKKVSPHGLNVGDRVEYIDADWGALPRFVGRRGSVEKVSGYEISIKWDSGESKEHPWRYLKKADEKPTLKSGDRVQYTGTATPHLKGKFGTVDRTYEGGSVYVDWDDAAIPRGVFISSVEKVDGLEFKAGDRVKYTGKSPLISAPAWVGWLGTVESVDSATNVNVAWDNLTGDPIRGHYPENLEKVEEVKTFKVGDSVRILNTGLPGHNKGDIGKVAVVEPGPNPIVKVTANGNSWWYVFDAVEKVEDNNNVNNIDWDFITTPATDVTATLPPAPVSAARDQAETFRDMADKLEGIVEAYEEVVDKLRETADALEAAADLADLYSN